jgi:WhiB family redox-sensing transcriptional regulator
MDDQPRGGPLGPDAWWGWRAHAACRSVDSELFFSAEGEGPRARSRRERRAKRVCAACPVAVPCRTYALAHREPYGVWGGLSERDRAAIWAASDSRSSPASRAAPA